MKGILISLSIVLIFASLVSSAGVSSPYWSPDKPLEIMPGETKTVYLNLQNKAGATEDLTFELELVKDGDGIAKIIDEDLLYFVVAGGDVDVEVEITAPEDAEIGKERIVEIMFSPLTEDNGGMVSLSARFPAKFPVLIVSESPPESQKEETPVAEKNDYLIYVLILAIIILIIYFLTRKRGIKKKKR